MATQITDAQAQMRREERAWVCVAVGLLPARLYELASQSPNATADEQLVLRDAIQILDGKHDAYCTECRHVTDVHGLCECCREEQASRAAILDARDRE